VNQTVSHKAGAAELRQGMRRHQTTRGTYHMPRQTPDDGTLEWWLHTAPLAASTKPEPNRPDDTAGADLVKASRRLRDRNGRFLGRSRKADSHGASFEASLIEIDSALFLAEQHRRLEMARTLLDAFLFNGQADQLEDALVVKAGMLVRVVHQGSQP
jgi:hypothetical protein